MSDHLKAAADAFFAKQKGGGSLVGLRCRIYVRVSDTAGRDGKDNFIAPEVQVGHCEDYARREGMVIVGDPVVDLNLSGKEFKKRSIMKMIEEVRDGQYDVIIVWKWSRWGRDLKESMINMALLKEVGGQLIAATEPADVSTPTGSFTVQQFLAMAELQLNQIRESWRDAHRNRLGKGLPHTGARVFGYVYDASKPVEEKYTPHPEQFPVLQHMYRMYIDGKTHRAIAIYLNERGITGNSGAKWHHSTVRQVLDQGFGAGRISYGEFEAFSDNWVHAITPEQWQAYKDRREEAGQRKLPPRTQAQQTAFKGLVFCADCERRFSLSRAKQTKNKGTAKEKVYEYSTWRCGGTVDFKCKGSMIRDALLEEAVIRWLRKFAEGMDSLPEMMARKLRATQALASIEEIDKQIRHYKALKKNGTHLLVAGTLTKEAYDEAEADYNERLEELAKARKQAEREAKVNATPPQDVFGSLVLAMEAKMDPDGLSTVLSEVIHRIYISKGRGLERVRIVPKWEVANVPEGEAV